MVFNVFDELIVVCDGVGSTLLESHETHVPYDEHSSLCLQCLRIAINCGTLSNTVRFNMRLSLLWVLEWLPISFNFVHTRKTLTSMCLTQWECT